MHGAHHRSRKRHGLVGNNAGNPKINDLRYHGFRQHDILGFNIAMDNVVLVSMSQRRSQLRRQRNGQRRVHTSVLFLKGFQADPFHIFHQNIADIPFVADVINRNNGRMDQAGRRTGLPLKLFQLGFAVQEFFTQYLDGDFPVQENIFGQIHFRHAAKSNGF